MKRLWLLPILLFSLVPAWAQPIGGEPVAIDAKAADGSALQLGAMLFKPPQPSKGGVVLMHGSGGWSDHREGHHARALQQAGYTALAVDSFRARGITGIAEDQLKLHGLLVTRDAFAARRFLIQQGIDPAKTVIMGFSKGGVASLFAADRNFLVDEVERFKIAIPFYPGCNSFPRRPKPASSILMILGEKDDYSGVKPCQDLAADFSKAGGDVTVKVYPDATHGFDGNPAIRSAVRAPTVENYMDCIAHVEEDGSITYDGKSYAQGDPEMTKAMQKTCVKKGATIWTNQTQKNRATADVIEYLNQKLAAP